MRGFATVLTVAFVFASASLLLGQAAGQGSTEPSQSSPAYPPEEYRQSPPDAFLQGVVSGPKGPVAGAYVSSYNYGSSEPRPLPAEDSGNGSSGSSTDQIACYGCYGGSNATVTDEQGHYQLGVWSGENQVSVQHNDFVGHSESVTVVAGETATRDISLQAYPDKTARIVGKVTDARTGSGLPFAQVMVRSPQFGPSECSQLEGTSSGSAGGAAPVPEGETKSAMLYYEPRPCIITMHDDGSFEGAVTPGYTIVTVYAYQDCSVSRDADGGGSTTCGPEYLQFSRTLTLPANQTTRIDVALQSRASPDATVSGYLVDAASGKAIGGGFISFNSQETYAYGHAMTDEDGSFKIRLRSGYHAVYVQAQGYLGWEGVLQVKAGSSDYDVLLTPGQEQYGGGFCCYAADGMEKTTATDVALPPGSPTAGSGMAENQMSQDGDDEEAGGEAYEDLGGGLGPYDASKRSDVGSDPGTEDADGRGAPGAGLLLALAAIGAVLVLRRRKA